MKSIKIILIAAFSALSLILNAQGITNGTILPSLDVNENAFLDLSTYNNATLNEGKGLIFPRTDLTLFKFYTNNINGIDFPSSFDGMIVYNTGTGLTNANPVIGGIQVSVEPGYYYFYNPVAEGSGDGVENGQWLPLSGLTGPTGPTGADGAQGVQGIQGPTGPQGSQGIQGPTGPSGFVNLSGSTNYVVKFTGASVGGNSLLYDNGTHIGLGTTSPTALLHTNGTGTGQGNVLFTGAYKAPAGAAPATGAGTRLMWYPDKAAFRAGSVNGVQWDTDSIGNYSIAMGYNAKSTATVSVAIGNAATASGNAALAMGYATTASGPYSVAIGHNTTALSFAEAVFGRYNTTYTPASATSWNTSDRLFVIGNGTSPSLSRNAITVLKNGNTGVGVDNPTALLHTNGTGAGQGNILFTGEYKSSGAGSTPVTGSGTRMMWYPDKAAFRVGNVHSVNWDTDSIGDFSIAGGYNNKAKGNYSLAMGGSTVASGTSSTALGNSTSATGSSSTAMGSSTTASGIHSTAMGYSTNASGQVATAMGESTIASGDNSTAMGESTTASGNYATAMGQSSTASGANSTVMGLNTSAFSFVETVLGRYNTTYTPISATSWSTADRLLVVGNGTGSSTRRDALVILKNGNTGIGISSPTAQLYVNGNGTGEGSVVFAGFFKSSGQGAVPVSGIGTRLMWYPDKAAFRVGYVSGGQWNKDSIGNYSVAMGFNTKSEGDYSTAQGANSSASGDYSTALGYFSNASGSYATATGWYSNASGYYSTATGTGTSAPSGYETVIGKHNSDYTPLSSTNWNAADRLLVVGNGTSSSVKSDAMVILKNGKTGFGISTPLALLHTKGIGTGEGNVLFEGEYKSIAGAVPVSGAGTRMMWYPDKAAFRAGYVSGLKWDKDSIGDYSVAMGYDNKALGERSTAFGYNNLASGYISTAFGEENISSGEKSTAIGEICTASGEGSIAMGFNSTASGHNSIAMGVANEANDEWAVAIGSHCKAYGYNSYTFGFNNRADGNFATALGKGAYAYGNNSFAINLDYYLAGPSVGESKFLISNAALIGGNLAWTNYSDRRLKKDIQYIEPEKNLDKIMQLNAVRYRWKEYNDLLNLGFIAQEVENIIPEAVRYDEVNDIYGMEYTAIIPVLVEGMKEQQQMIQSQKDAIDELKKFIEQQQKDIEVLKLQISK